MSLDQSTGDPGGRRALSGRDDDAHAVVATSSHGAAPGVDHEADQEPDGERRERKNKEERRKKKRQRVTGDRETRKEVTREGQDKKRNGKRSKNTHQFNSSIDGERGTFVEVKSLLML